MRIKLHRHFGDHPAGAVRDVRDLVPHGGHTDAAQQYVLWDGTHVPSDAATVETECTHEKLRRVRLEFEIESAGGAKPSLVTVELRAGTVEFTRFELNGDTPVGEVPTEDPLQRRYAHTGEHSVTLHLDWTDLAQRARFTRGES